MNQRAMGPPSGLNYRKDFKDVSSTGSFEEYFQAMHLKSHFYKFHILDE